MSLRRHNAYPELWVLFGGTTTSSVRRACMTWVVRERADASVVRTAGLGPEVISQRRYQRRTHQPNERATTLARSLASLPPPLQRHALLPVASCLQPAISGLSSGQGKRIQRWFVRMKVRARCVTQLCRSLCACSTSLGVDCKDVWREPSTHWFHSPRSMSA